MTLRTRGAKIAAATAAALLVIGVAFVAALVVLVRNAPDKPPTIAVYGDGEYREVTPFRYCPVQEPLCQYDGQTTEIALRAGYPLQISLPAAISDSPWGLATVYQGSDGKTVENDVFYEPETTVAVTVPGTDRNGRALVGVEVRLPSGVIDSDTAQEEIVSHAIWSVATPSKA